MKKLLTILVVRFLAMTPLVPAPIQERLSLPSCALANDEAERAYVAAIEASRRKPGHRYPMTRPPPASLWTPS